jgi:hypothetical protein
LCLQMIVGAALRGSGLRMPPFWIRHENPRVKTGPNSNRSEL